MYHYAHKGVDWVFVDHPCYPRPGGIYADEHGVYGDNQVRQQICDFEQQQLLQQRRPGSSWQERGEWAVVMQRGICRYTASCRSHQCNCWLRRLAVYRQWYYCRL